MPTIYYICFLPPKTGGELVNLLHVAALHRHGWRAVALVNPDADMDSLGETGSRFPVEILKPGRRFDSRDVVVIPEYYRDALRYFSALDCRAVLHVQGPYLLFRGVESISELNAAGFFGGLACSRFAAGMMRQMGAELNFSVVTPHVLSVFGASKLEKKRQIAFMPDKRPKEWQVVRALLATQFPQWRDVPWVAIANLSRRDCAAVMAKSSVFASFSCLEGLGLPPLEAMASDCLVCGFDGHGGRDYANALNGDWVAEGEHAGFAAALARTLALAEESSERGVAQRNARLQAGRDTAAQFSENNFERELLAAWRTLLGADSSLYSLEHAYA